MPTYVRWDRFGSDAATIVREYIAGRARRGRFQEFLAGRSEWLNRYRVGTLKKNYRLTIERYEQWRAGSKDNDSPSILT